MTSNKRIKITFVVPTLFAGGTERIASYLAQNIDKSRFDATLVVVGRAQDSAYALNDTNAVFLEQSRVLYGIPKLFGHLRKSRPDVVLSFISHLNALMAHLSMFFRDTKFIARESTVLSVDAELFKDQKKSVLHRFSGGSYFNSFEKIICQSTDMLIDIKTNYKVKDDKLVVINNPITNTFSVKENIDRNNPLKLITIARLSKEKGVPRILEALSKTSIPFHFTLIGDGPEKEHTMSLIREYGLQDRLTYIPFTRDVEKHLKSNDYFLQGSYVEGFPNALLESCTVGTPVIAFDVPGGTKEIVVDGINGFLVDNETELLERLQDNRQWNPDEVCESVYKKFNREKILKQYETLFFEVFNHH